MDVIGLVSVEEISGAILMAPKQAPKAALTLSHEHFNFILACQNLRLPATNCRNPMRYLRLISFALVCAALAVAASGQSPAERELKQLQDQRDKAVAAMVAPLDRRLLEAEEQVQRIKVERDKAFVAAKESVNRNFQAQFEQALRRATAANDFDAAIKIKQEMQAKAFTFTYLKDVSAKPFARKYKQNPFPEMTSENPEDVLKGKPIYFDKKSGMEIQYQVASPKPLKKLIYTGAAFSRFELEVVDAKNERLAGLGPIEGGNVLKTIELPLPDLANFKIIIREKSGQWMLIKELRLE